MAVDAIKKREHISQSCSGSFPTAGVIGVIGTKARSLTAPDNHPDAVQAAN